MSHENSGACLSCAKIFNRYPNFHLELRAWFEALQRKHPEAHISCAGRGKIDQEAAFHRGASRAHWGQSSHNFNAAIDVFELRNEVYTLDKDWFHQVIEPATSAAFSWYGKPGAVFYELPHIELADWREQRNAGKLRLVEP